MNEKIIAGSFQVESDIVSIEPYGNGHINHTFLVRAASGRRYILQRINTGIFHDPEDLMENILGVTAHLRKKIIMNGGDPARETLTVILSKDHRPLVRDDDGHSWRMYDFIEGAQAFDAVKGPQDFEQSGFAFGKFQSMLADYPADTLHETIPDFHNTPKRYEAFEQAVREDALGRVSSAQPEISFLRARKAEMSALHDRLTEGELPLRVTHNDTKLNNIMLDMQTHEAVCVIDLDTVMPGLSAYDFGDAIRFGANTAAEDERDLAKVSLSLEFFEAYARGFLRGCEGRLTAPEVAVLPLGAKIMTLECGMRFLADYLQGDIYFKTERDGHNLDRCRTQFALAADMEKKWRQMCDICHSLFNIYK